MLDLNYILCFALWEQILLCVLFLNLPPNLPCVLKLMLHSVIANHSIPAFTSFFPPLICLNIVSYKCGGNICEVISYLILWSRLYVQHKQLLCVLVAFKDSDQV